MMFKRISVAVLAFGLPLLQSTAAEETSRTLGNLRALGTPEWIRNLTIYEVNVRQFSDAGTFAAVEADLPRIKNLGVGVLWFMPVQPIGMTNRKGTLGSYYSVSDYRATNPEFGTKEDFVKLVAAAHSLDLKVVMDWVPNHTAWDHHWTKDHPDFYAKDANGSFVPPFGTDWTDVIQLDYTNHRLWDAMISDMAFWIHEAGIDGFRCDFAKGVPTEFWNEAAARLRAIRPGLFLLSEAETSQHQLAAFNASYSFGMMKVFNDVAGGKGTASKISDELTRDEVLFPQGSAFLRYTTNHDENTWQGTVFERLGGGVETFAVLSFVLDGIPLIYNGQEAGLDKRLEFFEHDPIGWRDHPLANLYQKLCALKSRHPALLTGAPMRRIATTENESVYIVLRTSRAGDVVAICNLTPREVTVDTVDSALMGSWWDAMTRETVTLDLPSTFKLPAWGYRILETKNE